MPQPCRRVLDVGCGAGSFAARLAQRNERVDALDRFAEMIEEARRGTPNNVNCVLADVLADSLPGKDYDAIFSISALHHTCRCKMHFWCSRLPCGPEGSSLPSPCLTF
jgi:2-polyprenyl-3-methyl-5-hydroxy-6-metoxy-1,4-benzoquinol methylase